MNKITAKVLLMILLVILIIVEPLFLVWVAEKVEIAVPYHENAIAPYSLGDDWWAGMMFNLGLVFLFFFFFLLFSVLDFVSDSILKIKR